MNPFAALSEPIHVRPIGTVSHVNETKPEKRSYIRTKFPPTVGPWKLSPRQAEVIEAVIKHETLTDAAAALGVRMNGIEATMARVRAKMSAKTTLGAAIAYDRWKRKQCS